METEIHAMSADGREVRIGLLPGMFVVTAIPVNWDGGPIPSDWRATHAELSRAVEELFRKYDDTPATFRWKTRRNLQTEGWSMTTTDVIVVAQRHSCALDKAILEFAQHTNAKHWTEASVCWGKVVSHARALADLEHIMRQVIWDESQATSSTNEAGSR